ncbi:MAG: potassium channel family protein [Simkaniaceae bacterium]|nr:potassium channel family protein [Simkaniaceae bacterium]
MAKNAFTKLRSMTKTHFTQLMVFLVVLFVFRPYDRGPIYDGIWTFFFTLAILASVFNCRHTKGMKIAVGVLAIPGMVLSWVCLAFPHPIVIGLFLFLTSAAIVLCSCSILARVILNATVTLETLRGTICVYFLIAFAFAFIYYLIEFLIPGSFHLIDKDASFYAHNHYLSEMLYFSFVTLLTIGYGDIAARLDIAQTFTIIEGIVGQFYIAILVARLVAVYSYLSHVKDEKKT